MRTVFGKTKAVIARIAPMTEKAIDCLVIRTDFWWKEFAVWIRLDHATHYGLLTFLIKIRPALSNNLKAGNPLAVGLSGVSALPETELSN